jgi:hypothetical protein
MTGHAGAGRATVPRRQPEPHVTRSVVPVVVHVGVADVQPARIVSRSPAAGGEPPHLLIICAVVSGRSQQPFGLRLRPSVSDPLLIHEQLPRHQARTRAAGLVEVRDHLRHLLHSNLIHLWPRASVPPPWPPLRHPVQSCALRLYAMAAPFRPALA